MSAMKLGKRAWVILECNSAPWKTIGSVRGVAHPADGRLLVSKNWLQNTVKKLPKQNISATCGIEKSTKCALKEGIQHRIPLTGKTSSGIQHHLREVVDDLHLIKCLVGGILKTTNGEKLGRYYWHSAVAKTLMISY